MVLYNYTERDKEKIETSKVVKQMNIVNTGIDKEKVAKKLRELRGNIPRKSLANVLGVGTTAIGNYEDGKRIPVDDVKLRYSLFFNIPVDEIFFRY